MIILIVIIICVVVRRKRSQNNRQSNAPYAVDLDDGYEAIGSLDNAPSFSAAQNAAPPPPLQGADDDRFTSAVFDSTPFVPPSVF